MVTLEFCERVLEFESCRGEIFNLFARMKKGSTAESVYVEEWVGAIRRESTREEKR